MFALRLRTLVPSFNPIKYFWDWESWERELKWWGWDGVEEEEEARAGNAKCPLRTVVLLVYLVKEGVAKLWPWQGELISEWGGR